ncbi:MAG: hypothetical protein L6R42_000846 [Xanthoria sp. 1 TBL-2021]|nr:MAG: hypothetical protein L6R42_000846 [Xanthoria sp. 1 TBL-2021]
MDSSHRDSRPQGGRPVPSPHSAQAIADLQNLQESSGHAFNSTSEMNGSLRRGHSDGDVYGPPFRGPRAGRGTDEETWMDFLQESSHPQRNAGTSSLGSSIRSFGTQDTVRRQERQASMQRAALMMADRKRRLTENQEDYNHRRSASSLPFGPSMTLPTSSHLPSSGPDWNFARPARAPSSSINDRPLPPRPDIASGRNRESREIILPIWQSDSEVTRCPICKTNFGFWITIPRQFIVQPPHDENQTAREGTSAGIEVVDLTEEEDAGVASRSNTENPDTPRSPPVKIDPALGGGQEVRLCNPCVPDPNPLPHLPFGAPDPSAMHSFPRPSFDSVRMPEDGSSNRSTSGSLRRSPSPRPSFDRVQMPGRHGGEGSSSSVPGAREQEHDFSRFPSRHSSRLPPNFTSLHRSVPNHSLHERYPDTMVTPLQLRHRHHVSASNVPPSRYRSASDAPQVLHPPRSHPARSQPQLREEDECPICHQALPPKGPNDSETNREAHVAECIAQHFSSSAPRAARPHPSMATEAAVAASAANTTQSPNNGSGAQGPHERRGSESAVQGSSNGHNAFERMGSQRRRVVGMFKYLATEKDCIGEGGEPAECVICFEEFEQGVEMGRLECLCKFHKACIRQWWDTKGPGSCPVHQGGLT